jgi:multiple sugar transport system substrate-binding protein
VLGGFPTVKGGSFKKPTLFYGETGQGFWVTKNGAKNIDAVEKFVKFLYQPDSINAFVTDGALFPVSPVAADAPKPTNPLQAQSLQLHDSSGLLTIWDNLSPVGWDPSAAVQALYAGASVDTTCAALEDGWKTAKS